MKQIFGEGAKLFARTLVVILMSFFICVSISVLCTAAFTERTGYEVYGYLENEEDSVHLYTHDLKDGEDEQMQKYEDEGYTLRTADLRTALSKKGNIIFLTATQLCATTLLLAFVYPSLWNLGTKDSNLVRFKHQKEDKWKGLKIGLVSQIPAFLLWLGTLVCALGANKTLPLALYRFINCHHYSFIQVIFAQDRTVGDLGVGQFVLLLLLLAIVPVAAQVGYMLGYKNFSIAERLIYKNVKKSGKER